MLEPIYHRVPDSSHTALRKLAARLTLAEERERRRIAAELHDGAAQSLGMAGMRLGKLAQGAADAGVRAEAETVKALIDQAIRELRSQTTELSPPMLYESDLLPTLEWLVERVKRRYGLSCRMVCVGSLPDATQDQKVLVFQFVRELLLNVVKHASATRADIHVRALDGIVEVCVRDDGVGISPDVQHAQPSASGGFGLFSIRERLGLLGGTLKVRAADRGTLASFRIQLG